MSLQQHPDPMLLVSSLMSSLKRLLVRLQILYVISSLNVLRPTLFSKVVPLLSDAKQAAKLLKKADGLSELIIDPESMGQAMIEVLGRVGVKTALRIAERTVADAHIGMADNPRKAQARALEQILGDLQSDGVSAQELCEVIL